MKILQPHKISTEILDTIYEAKKHLVIVSPYVNLINWERLTAELKSAIKRGVQIDFYVRNEPENAKSWEQVLALGIQPHLVANLHAKFYFNEKCGVISSMNLLSSSNSNSIEIGCKLETQDELDELRRFLDDFICTNESTDIPDEDELYLSKEKFMVVLENYLANQLECRTSVFYKNGEFTIKTISNSFQMGIDKVENCIWIIAVLSSKEAEGYATKGKNFFKSKYFDYKVIFGEKGHYDLLQIVSKVRLSNSYLDNLRVNEKKDLIDEITELFDSIRGYKESFR